MPRLEIRTVSDITVLAAVEIAPGSWEVTVRSSCGKSEPQVIGYWQCSEHTVRDRLGYIVGWHEMDNNRNVEV